MYQKKIEKDISLLSFLTEFYFRLRQYYCYIAVKNQVSHVAELYDGGCICISKANGAIRNQWNVYDENETEINLLLGLFWNLESWLVFFGNILDTIFPFAFYFIPSELNMIPFFLGWLDFLKLVLKSSMLRNCVCVLENLVISD